jgi:hypothetical protein
MARKVVKDGLPALTLLLFGVTWLAVEGNSDNDPVRIFDKLNKADSVT